MLICYHIYIYKYDREIKIDVSKSLLIRRVWRYQRCNQNPLLFRFHSIIIFCMYIILFVNYNITLILVLCIHANQWVR